MLENKFELNKSKLQKEWEFQGNIDITKDGLQITNSPSGCLIKNDYWDRLKRKELDFRKVLGIIFRAQSFDEYFMIGVWKVENHLIFRPHVRLCFKLLTKAEKVCMYIKINSNWEQCFRWYLPLFYKVNLNEGLKNDNTSEFITRKITFMNLPGQFGFRNYGNELATVRSLTIKGNFSEEDTNLFNQ